MDERIEWCRHVAERMGWLLRGVRAELVRDDGERNWEVAMSSVRQVRLMCQRLEREYARSIGRR